jgi:hypothetical protein
MTEPTALQSFEYHRKAFAGVDATLQERIAANLDLARKPWQSPHMKRYYVQVARLQNRMILSNRRRLIDMAQGAEIEPPTRKPYVPKPRRAPDHPFATLTPLEIALAQEPGPNNRANITLEMCAPTPWPDVELVQGSLF